MTQRLARTVTEVTRTFRTDEPLKSGDSRYVSRASTRAGMFGIGCAAA